MCSMVHLTSTERCSVVECSTVHESADRVVLCIMLWSRDQCWKQCSAVECSVFQSSAVQCSAVECIIVLYYIIVL